MGELLTFWSNRAIIYKYLVFVRRCKTLRVILGKNDKKMYCEALAENLPVFRAKLGVNQEDLANRIGLSRNMLACIETKKKEMSWITFVALTLLFLKNDNYGKFINQYKQYGMKFDTFDNFCTKHFLVGENCYIRNGEVFKYSHGNSSEEVIETMKNLIKARADLISKDKKVCDKLYNLWEQLNL